MKSYSINCAFECLCRLNRRILMLALIKDQSFIWDMLLWQQRTIPVSHYAVCDSVYKNHHSFNQHCPAVKENHARPWSLHLRDNDFCSPLIISFGRCASGCLDTEKSWLASQEDAHKSITSGWNQHSFNCTAECTERVLTLWKQSRQGH